MKKRLIICFLLFPIGFSSFLNIPTSLSHVTSSSIKSSTSLSDQVDYLIITTEDFSPSLKDLQAWKMQKGLYTQIITTLEIQATYSGVDLAAKIKNCILSHYENNGTQWVLLAGDNERVPSRLIKTAEEHPGHDAGYVLSDSYYSDLDHNWDSNNDSFWGTDQDEFDFNPEVYVGRLTANTVNEMDKLVSNILSYEKDPPLGDWMTRAFFAGAMLVFNEDWDNDSIVDFEEADANRHFNFLSQRLPSNWSYILQAEADGLSPSQHPYNESITPSHLEDQINEGNGIVYITGHGNSQTMFRTTFEYDEDGDGLFDWEGEPMEGGEPVDLQVSSPVISDLLTQIDPTQSLGMYYLGGCSTGTFDDESDCIAEYILKTTAIGCIAGSHVVWGEDQWTERNHGGWYSEGLQSRFLEYLLVHPQPGKALALAKQDYLDDIETLEENLEYPGWSNRIIQQFNLLGDPEVSIWMAQPSSLNLSLLSTNGTSPQSYRVTSAGIPIENATFTVFQNETLLWKGTSSADGVLDVPFTSAELNKSILTVSKPNFLPFQDPFIAPKEVTITDTTKVPTESNSEEETNDAWKIPGYGNNLIAITMFGLMWLIYTERRRKNNRE